MSSAYGDGNAPLPKPPKPFVTLVAIDRQTAIKALDNAGERSGNREFGIGAIRCFLPPDVNAALDRFLARVPPVPCPVCEEGQIITGHLPNGDEISHQCAQCGGSGNG